MLLPFPPITVIRVTLLVAPDAVAVGHAFPHCPLVDASTEFQLLDLLNCAATTFGIIHGQVLWLNLIVMI